MKNTKAFSHEHFISLLKEYYSDKYTFDKVLYRGAGNKITVTCKVHGDFITYASSFLNSEEFSGCKKCREEKRARLKKLQSVKKVKRVSENPHRDTLIRLCNKNHENRYDYSATEYSGVEETIEVRCPAHGLFTTDAARHKRGHAPCPVCRRNRQRRGKNFADMEFERLSQKNGDTQKSHK